MFFRLTRRTRKNRSRTAQPRHRLPRGLLLESLETRRLMAGDLDVGAGQGGQGNGGGAVLVGDANPGAAGGQAAGPVAPALDADDVTTLAGTTQGERALAAIRQQQQRVQDAQQKLDNAKAELENSPAYKKLQEDIAETAKQLDENQQQIEDTQKIIDDLERRADDPHIENPVDYQVHRLPDGSYREVEVTHVDGRNIGIKTYPPVNPKAELKRLVDEKTELETQLQQQQAQLDKMRKDKLEPCEKALAREQARLARQVESAERLADAIRTRQAAEEKRQRRVREPAAEPEIKPTVHDGMLINIKSPFQGKDDLSVVNALLKGIASQRAHSGKKPSNEEKLFLNQLCNDKFTNLTRTLGQMVKMITGFATSSPKEIAVDLVKQLLEVAKGLRTPSSHTIPDVREYATGSDDDIVARTTVTTVIQGDKFVVLVEMKVDASKTNPRQVETGPVTSGTYRYVYSGTLIR